MASTCPKCRGPLIRTTGELGSFLECHQCGGRLIKKSLLRELGGQRFADALWNQPIWNRGKSRMKCPLCRRSMVEIPTELGSNTSTINEEITITNLSNDDLDFHFFQYCDLDLGGTALDTSAEIVGQNTAVQVDAGSAFASECADTPSPNGYEVNYVDNILTSLNDAGPTVLSNTAGPMYNGNLSWAFEWDFTLVAVVMTKN